MSEQYFTRPNVQPVITNIGTTPEQRQMSTSEFKAKFDEMPEAIQQYIKETLLVELDAFKEEFMTHLAENVTQAHGFIYEEGEWTPQFNTSFNGVYGTQRGRYIRKGNEVTLFFELEATTFSLTDDAQICIRGFPFDTDQNFPTTATINCYGKNTEGEISFEVVSIYNVLYGYLYSNTGKALLRKNSLNGSFYVKGSVVYRIRA